MEFEATPGIPAYISDDIFPGEKKISRWTTKQIVIKIIFQSADYLMHCNKNKNVVITEQTAVPGIFRRVLWFLSIFVETDIKKKNNWEVVATLWYKQSA